MKTCSSSRAGFRPGSSGGKGGGESLAATLVLGNATGGKNINFSGTDVIRRTSDNLFSIGFSLPTSSGTGGSIELSAQSSGAGGDGGNINLRPGTGYSGFKNGYVDVFDTFIKNVADPVDATDAVNKIYVDSLLGALNTDVITNNSAVAGATASDALDTLNTELSALALTVANLDSDDIANSSGIGGGAGSVTTALDTVDDAFDNTLTGPLNTYLRGTGAGNVWSAISTLPANPGDNGKVTLASGGNFAYLAGSAAGQALIWSAGNAWTSGNHATANDFADRNLITTGKLLIGVTSGHTSYPSAGAIDVPHDTYVISGRNSTDTTDRCLLDWGRLAANRLTFGDGTFEIRVNAATLWSVQIASSSRLLLGATAMGLLVPLLDFERTVAAPIINQLNKVATEGAANNLIVRAQGAVDAGLAGGSLILDGGRCGSGGDRGGVKLRLNTDDSTIVTMAEIAGLAGGARRVVSLGLAADITTTQMPANTGDKVVFVANAATNPSADAVGGFLLYSDGALPALRYNGSNLRLDGTAGTANAGAGAALPLTVQGYLSATLNGTAVRIPYYLS